MTRRMAIAACILGLVACESNPHASSRERARIAAANAFTSRYAESRLARWKLDAHAAGDDCGVLLVETRVVMEDTMVDALHYGAPAYEAYPGGVQQFSRDRRFRGVAYRDATRRQWMFGSVSPDEALVPCR